MAGDEEGHHLVDELFVGETARLQSDGYDVDTSLLLLHGLAFAPDEISACLLDELLSLHKLLIPLDRQILEQPEGNEKAHDLPKLASARSEVEYILIVTVQFVVRIPECVELYTHTRLADNVEGRARTPLADINSSRGVSDSVRG